MQRSILPSNLRRKLYPVPVHAVRKRALCKENSIPFVIRPPIFHDVTISSVSPNGAQHRIIFSAEPESWLLTQLSKGDLTVKF
jgi:hypothetical protein